MLSGNDTRMCDKNNDCEGGDWDENCLPVDLDGAVLISGGESRTRGVYELVYKQDAENIPLFYSRVDGGGYLSWWKGQDGQGEWLIGADMSGVVGKVYSAPGNNSVVPTSNWTDAN